MARLELASLVGETMSLDDMKATIHLFENDASADHVSAYQFLAGLIVSKSRNR